MKPAVKILKTPENSFLAQKRISGVSFFIVTSYSVTGSGHEIIL